MPSFAPLAVSAVVVLAVALAALRGWRVGGVSTLIKLASGLVGLFLGLGAAGLLSSALSPVVHVALGMLCAVGGLLIGASVGRRLSRAVARSTRRAAPAVRMVDRGLGVLVRGGIAALVCATLAGLFVAFGPPGLAATLRAAPLLPDSGSDVPVAGAAWTGVTGLLSDAAPGDLAALVPDGSAGGLDQSAVAAVDRRVGRSVLRIASDACGTSVSGTGFAVARSDGHDLIVTNAHVVRGADRVSVDGESATVVAFDARADLAVLREGDGGPATLPLASTDAANGARLVVVGYPEGGSRTAIPATVLQRVPVPNPGGSGGGLHEAYRLRSSVRHGNSGSPLLDTSGRVVGVVNALSGSDGDQGYAITLDELRPVLASAGATAATQSPVSTGSCS